MQLRQMRQARRYTVIAGSSSQQKMLLGLLAAWGSNRLLNVLAADEWVWMAHDISMSLSFALAALIVAQLTPYKNLRQKCIAALIAGGAIVDIAFSMIRPDGYLAWIFAQAAGGASLSAFYWLRSHAHSHDFAAEDDRIYCIRRIPARLQDLAISMLGIYGPDGGYALYAGGFMYKYSSGRLVRRKVSSVPSIGYHVCRGSKIDEAVMSELNSLVGSEWSWRKNCLTVLAPIWRRHSG